MKRNFRHRNSLLYFSRWSRKGYAVFAALGKNVAISAVPIDVCESALLKSGRKGLIVSEAGCAQEEQAAEDDGLRKEKEGLPVSMGKVCADENGGNLNKYNNIRRYAAYRRTSFL